jgi:predicted amino acid racemase
MNKFPKLIVDLNKIRHNAKILNSLVNKINGHIFAVTKVLSGEPKLAKAFVDAGIHNIADSRIENLIKIRNSKYFKNNDLKIQYMLLRIPSIEEIEHVVLNSDVSLNSEIETIKKIDKVCKRLNLKHKIIFMIDLGDLREGVFFENAVEEFGKILEFKNIEIFGIGTNLACYGGVIPTKNNMEKLIDIKNNIENTYNIKIKNISGGNSSSYYMLRDNLMPPLINSYRFGESIILGKDVIDRSNIEGAYFDTTILQTKIIELKEKPSIPIGRTGQNAFGENSDYINRGIRKRAILAIGRQDVNFEGLMPIDKDIIILGASSDHLIIDVSDSKHKYKLYDTVEFIPNYGALLALSTSKYVNKEFINV